MILIRVATSAFSLVTYYMPIGLREVCTKPLGAFEVRRRIIISVNSDSYDISQRKAHGLRAYGYRCIPVQRGEHGVMINKREVGLTLHISPGGRRVER